MQKRVQTLIQENAPTLLTAGGVVGTVATAVLAWRGGTKYSEFLTDQVEARMLIASRENQDMEPFTRIEKIQMAVPHLAPPVLTGSTTVAAIIMANRMSAQKAAALAAMYGLAEGRLTEYKEKVAERLTPAKEQKIQDELAQERVNNTPGSNQIVVIEGEVLCFDSPTGRYFRSTMEHIMRAVNATNAEILHADHVRASFFYEELGLPATTWTDEVGWNSDRLLELAISTVLSPDERPCIAIDFKTLPKIDYVPKHY
jgi:hypothetical protein